MTKRLLAAVAAAVLMTGAGAAQEHASITGSWAMTIQSGGSHADMKATLELKLEGTKVSGSFTSPHAGNRPVEGEFKDGNLTFAITATDGDTRIGFSATLRDARTLAGYMSTPGGDMKWTATRDKGSR